MGQVTSTDVSEVSPQEKRAVESFSQAQSNHLYGTFLEIPDSNVQYYLFPSTETLPQNVDLRFSACAPYPRVVNQGLLSNCSSLSVTAAFQCVQRRNKQSPLIDPSATYNYFLARKMDSGSSFDAGTSVTSALAAGMLGFPTEQEWPYNPSNVNREPPVEVQREALKHSVHQWDRLFPSLDNLRRCLAQGYPILASFQITKPFDQWFRNRNLQLSTDFVLTAEEFHKSDIVGAHTVLLVGYNNSKGNNQGAFFCRNSWGPEWGTEQGHFWIDYGTLLFPELVHAFFMIKATCSDDKGLCVSKADCMSVYEPQVCTSTNIKE